VLTEIKKKSVNGAENRSLSVGEPRKDKTPMKAMIVLLTVAGALTVGAAQAQDVLKAKGCLSCHDPEKKKMGPALKDIAAKYKGDSAAEATLVAKVKEGKGHPKVKANDDEIKAAVQEILGSK
jgi:cytochrome c